MSSPIGSRPDPETRIPGFLSRSRSNDAPHDTHVEPTLPPTPVIDDYAPVKRWESKPSGERNVELLDHLATVLQDRLCEIAHLIVKLTYTDMIDLSKGIEANPEKIIEWSRAYIENPPKKDR